MSSIDASVGLTRQESWLSKKKLAKYFMYSVLGPGLPMVLALFTVPFMLKHLGVDRFGLLSLAWVILGYFTLFDFGLGRAAVRLYAEKLAQGETATVRTIFFTTFSVTLFIGLVLGLVFGLTSDYFAQHLFKISSIEMGEARGELLCLAFGMPFAALTVIFRGFLEVEQKFFLSNALQSVVGVLTYLGPVVIVLWQNSLVWIVGIMIAVRAIVFFTYFIMSYRALPSGSESSHFDRSVLRQLWQMGSWVTISNLVGPLIVYADRFIIGSVVSIGAIAYYSTPYDLVTRVWVVTGALSQVLFPAFSSLAFSQPHKSDELFRFGLDAILNLIFPVVFIVLSFAPEGLKLWLGPAFALESYRILQIFCFGVLLNCVAQINFVYLQSLNRADLPAKIQLFEVVFYLGGIYLAATTHSLKAVAAVWTLRMLVDSSMMCYALFRVRSTVSAEIRRQTPRVLALLGVMAVAMCLNSIGLRIAYLVAVGGLFYWNFTRPYVQGREWSSLLKFRKS